MHTSRSCIAWHLSATQSSQRPRTAQPKYGRSSLLHARYDVYTCSGQGLSRRRPRAAECICWRALLRYICQHCSHLHTLLLRMAGLSRHMCYIALLSSTGQTVSILDVRDGKLMASFNMVPVIHVVISHSTMIITKGASLWAINGSLCLNGKSVFTVSRTSLFSYYCHLCLIYSQRTAAIWPRSSCGESWRSNKSCT